MKPTISVIMPFYNRADVLPATLDSLLAQTYTDFELIGVDDGSTDDAPQVFQAYAARDRRCKLITKPHTNAGDARNLGYEHSRGDYLIFLDADDLLEPDFLATLLSTLQQEDSDLAVCVADEFDHRTGQVTRSRHFRQVDFTQTVTTLTASALRPHLFTVMLPAVWNRLFKRAVIEQYHLRFQSLTNSNDIYFSFAYLIYAQRVTFINRVLIHHRTGDPRSLSARENTHTDKFNRCLALDYLRAQLPAATFQTLDSVYYAYYFQKALHGIIRSNFAQGQHIFTHTREVLADQMHTAFPQHRPAERKFLVSLKKNDFAALYRWLRRHKILLLNDPTADSQMKTRHPAPAKILLLIEYLADGGAERVASLWAQMLATAGYAVTVLTFYPLPHEYPLDPRVTRANLFDSADQYAQTNQKVVTRRKLLEKYLAAHPQDVLIPFLSSTNLLAALCDQTHVPTVTQTIRNSPWHEKQGLELALRDWAIQKQGVVILQNAEQMEYFNAKAFQHVKKYVVHNPLNPDIAKIAKDHYGPIQKLVAVGRLVPQKNHALMIEAIRILRDEFHETYALDIYGTGELHDTLQAQIDQAKLGEQVKLCGYHAEIFPTLINYDLFLMTSCFEGTPNALLEAMGLGLPSLAIKCHTGIAELIEDGKNGYLLDTYDAHALARKIRQINKPEQLATIGRQARTDMTRYAPTQIQNELGCIIQDLLATPQRPTNRQNTWQENEFHTILDYQNYCEASLRLIKIANYQLAKQIFNRARHVLKNIEITPPQTDKIQILFLICLRQNQFDVFYQFLQNSVI